MQGGCKGWCCAHCKAACMTACVAYNYKSRGKKGNICYPKQNGCTTILADFQLRAFVPCSLSPFSSPAWRLRMDYYIRVSHALTQRALSILYIEIFISKAKMRTKRTCPAQKATALHVRTLMYFLCLCFPVFIAFKLRSLHSSRLQPWRKTCKPTEV